MADLIVTSIAVDEAARQLGTIKDDLENSDQNRSDWKNIFGHPIVNDAVYDFIDDWWVKREKLLDNIDDLHKKMEKAAETWADAELQLTDALQGEDG
jgi:hypothetical protein